jgi:hypothetical protein
MEQHSYYKKEKATEIASSADYNLFELSVNSLIKSGRTVVTMKNYVSYATKTWIRLIEEKLKARTLNEQYVGSITV